MAAYPADAGAPSGPSGAVLLVDDRPTNLVALEGILADLGAPLISAPSAPDALEALLARDIALAVVDVQMPDMDGFELARLMRGAERTRRVPIIFVTAGEVSATSRGRGYDLGAVDYIAKPIDPHALRSKVTAFLQLDAQRRALEAALADRDRLVAELEEAARERAEAEALLENLVQAAPIGIAFLDEELRYRRVNAALAAMNGIPGEAHLGRRPSELLPGVDFTEWEVALQKALRTGEAVRDLTVLGTTPATGEARHVWAETIYVVRHGGRTAGVAVLVRDVTQERRVDELQRLLLGIVGHDLRTPLSVLLQGVDLLARPEVPEPLRERAAERARRAGAQMNGLIRDLLDFTRARGGAALAIAPAPADLAGVVEAAVESVAESAGGRAVEVAGEGDPRGVWDAGRLRQVLDNLVSNAVKYGDPAAPITVRWDGRGDPVSIEVVNRGPDLPAEALPALFEPLAQASSSKGGIGLGLYIAREIVRAHGGSIAARSAGGEIAFTVRLPRVAPGAGAAP